jgi:dihydrofolate reductase
LKQQPGRDIGVFGSSNLAVTLAEQGLIDEYRIIVNPVFLGEGTPLLEGIKDKIELKLLEARTFESGNVLLSYAPVRK